MTHKSEDLITEVNKIIARYETPLTLRQIYYQLVAALIIPNNLNSYKSLGKILTKAREQKKVDHRRIEDRGRQALGGDYAHYEIDEFYEMRRDEFKNSAASYSRPVWFGQKYYLEVFVEKDALSRLVSSIADGLGVTTCIAKGYSSFSFVKRATERIRHQCLFSADDIEYKQPVILYFGDFDPSGQDMVRDLQRRLLEYGLDEWVEDEYREDEDEGESQVGLVSKLALTMEQITEYKLPPAPVKMSDVRAAKFIEEYGDEVVELDALDPRLLQKFVKEGIEKYIDRKIWDENQKKEEEDRKAIQEKVDAHFEDKEDDD